MRKLGKLLPIAMTLMMISTGLAQNPSAQRSDKKTEPAEPNRLSERTVALDQLSHLVALKVRHTATNRSTITTSEPDDNAVSTNNHESTLAAKKKIEALIGGPKSSDETEQAMTALRMMFRKVSLMAANLVKSLNGLTGDLNLAAGQNITITTDPSTNTLTVAAPNALGSVTHDSTLSGNGTNTSPLRVAVPFTLNGSVLGPIITVNNTAQGGQAIFARSGPEGVGLQAIGADGNNGGFGVVALAGNGTSGPGGKGIVATGGDSIGVYGGIGAQVLGGSSRDAKGGIGAFVAGGAGFAGGIGVEALGGDSGSGSGYGGDAVAATGGTGYFLGGPALTAKGGDATDVISYGGYAISARGGTGKVAAGVGIHAAGGDIPAGESGRAGIGISVTGGRSDQSPGMGAYVVGGASTIGNGGAGATIWGGGSSNASGGDGLIARAGHGATGNGRAGVFEGDVQVNGNLNVTGTKNFKIDHPLDPENKYLYHAAIESSEVLNVYSGNVMLDANGQAKVTLPAWFQTLNGDYRYQLTAVGTAAPGLYIAEEIANNHFKIAGGAPGMKVSWQVTGTRRDTWTKAHPMQVEEDKPERDRARK